MEQVGSWRISGRGFLGAILDSFRLSGAHLQKRRGVLGRTLTLIVIKHGLLQITENHFRLEGVLIIKILECR